MTRDDAHNDAHTSHNHGFELPETPQVEPREASRPWRALAGVALCLGLAGIVTGLIVAHRQSVSDEHLTSDALQREDLRDGWKALGAAAERDARSNSAQASSAPSPPVPPANVVIVNVPAASAAVPPPNVTNINLPSAPASGSNAALPERANSTNSGYEPMQSLPAINFSPVPGYLPTTAPVPGYLPTAAGDATSPVSSAPPVTSSLPPIPYAPSTASPAPFTPPIGNGSIPGSVPNPALPNTGLVGTVSPGSPAPGSTAP